MPGPWEKYGSAQAAPGPWVKYGAASERPKPSILQRAGEAVRGYASGIGKGVFKSGLGISKIIGRVPKETTLSDIGMEPQGTAEKAGMMTEQIGEFFLPGGAVSRGVKAASRLGKVAQLGARVGLEAGAMGGVTAAQTGGDLKAVGTSAALAGGIPLVGAATKPLIDPIKRVLSQKVAPRLINSLIKPPKKQLMFGKDPGMEVAKLGIKANSLGGLEKEITAKLDKTGGFIDEVLMKPANAAKRVDITPAISGPIDDAIRMHRTTTGNQAAIGSLESMKDALLVQRFPGLRNVRLSPMEATKLKREIGKAMKWSDDPVEASLNDVRQEIFGKLKDAINKEVPTVRPFNGSYANLLAAQKSVQNRVDAVSKLELLGLTQAGMAAAGALTAAMMGGGVSHAVIGAVIGGAGTKVMKSTPAVTRFAAAFGKLSPEEKTVFATKVVPVLRNAFLASSPGAQQ